MTSLRPAARICQSIRNRVSLDLLALELDKLPARFNIIAGENEMLHQCGGADKRGSAFQPSPDNASSHPTMQDHHTSASRGAPIRVVAHRRTPSRSNSTAAFRFQRSRANKRRSCLATNTGAAAHSHPQLRCSRQGVGPSIPEMK
jgi:hypothetical protein